MVTIRDVAKRAGVSPITVSRVINHNEHVRPETRRIVERAIADLDYIPNALGPSLRSKRTQTLALVVNNIMNPFWTTVARGVEDFANRHGYHVIIGNTDESPAKQEEYLVFLLQKQVDGFLLVPLSPRSLDTLHKRGTPFVVLDRRMPDAHCDTVRGDSEGGAHALTRHLVSLGHERIAIVSGPRAVSTASDRVAGYRRALREAGLRRSEQVYWGEYSIEGGSRATREILRTDPPATAIFAGNNFIAVGTMRALHEAGTRVPEDISLVAFDDLTPGIMIDPFLTVAAQPGYEMGERATDLLLARLSGVGPEGHQEIVMPVEIIVRRSSAPPAHHQRRAAITTASPATREEGMTLAKRILVTGPTGKVGRTFIRRLFEDPEHDAATVRALCHNRMLEPGARLEVMRGSIADRAVVEAAMEGVSHVVHLATCKETPDDVIDVTVKGLFWLLEACRTSPSFERFVLIGGDAGVGHCVYPHPIPVTETQRHTAYPGSYALSKVLEEVMLEQYYVQYDFDGTCVRAPWIMEKDDFRYQLSFGDDIFGGIIWRDYVGAEAAAEYVRNGTVPIMLDAAGQAVKRNFVHVEDLVSAILIALDHPGAQGQTFNICMDEPVDYGLMADYLGEHYGLPNVGIKTAFHSTWLDNTKAKLTLGWRPTYDLARLIDAAWSYQRATDDPRKVWYPG